jgi:HEAT repeat protein
MRWFFALLIVAGSSFYLYQQYNLMKHPPAPPPSPPAMTALPEPQPFLADKELKSVMKSTTDGDPGVRWAAIELLYTVKAPESLSIVERTIADDPDPEIRIKAVQLLNRNGGSRQVPGLVKGLNDIDKDVRIAALKALGTVGDPAAAPAVAALLKDPESDVKTEALHTLGLFQEKRVKDFHELTEQLRHQYEAAVKKSQKNSE